MTLDTQLISQLLNNSITAALKAGKEISKIYETDDFNVEMKSDNSPLTKADKASHNIIIENLPKEIDNHSIQLLSEEGKDIPYNERKNWELYWLIDPLDGTKEFIKRNGEFTVNIALIENNEPILGVIYAPEYEAMIKDKSKKEKASVIFTRRSESEGGPDEHVPLSFSRKPESNQNVIFSRRSESEGGPDEPVPLSFSGKPESNLVDGEILNQVQNDNGNLNTLILSGSKRNPDGIYRGLNQIFAQSENFKGTLYFAAKDFGAFKAFYSNNELRMTRLNSQFSILNSKFKTAVGSRSHSSEEEKAKLDELGVTETISVGSSLKFCMVAEANAQVYYRHGPTMEWDVAAGYSIAKEAGAKIEGLQFNKENLLNSSFLVKS